MLYQYLKVFIRPKLYSIEHTEAFNFWTWLVSYSGVLTSDPTREGYVSINFGSELLFLISHFNIDIKLQMSYIQEELFC